MAWAIQVGEGSFIGHDGDTCELEGAQLCENEGDAKELLNDGLFWGLLHDYGLAVEDCSIVSVDIELSESE